MNWAKTIRDAVPEMGNSRREPVPVSPNIDMARQIADLQATVSLQSERIRSMENQLPATIRGQAVGAISPASKPSISRAGLLKATAGVTALAVGAKFGTDLTPGRARAAAAPHRARRASQDANFTAYGSDSAYSGNSAVGFDASDQSSGLQAGAAFWGSTAGMVASTNGKYAVQAINTSGKSGSIGVVAAAAGIGVGGVTSSGAGIVGLADQNGFGILGESRVGIGVAGTSTGNGGAGVYAENTKQGIGLAAISKYGVGAVLSGGRASLQLMPSTYKSHPKKGQVGQIMVDAKHRLWFCQRGGDPATWVQIV